MAQAKTKLLIVDDEHSIRTSMSQVLTAVGYQVRYAEDGLSALVEMRNEVPDILLADLIMPGMSGHELLSVVRRRFPSIQRPTLKHQWIMLLGAGAGAGADGAGGGGTTELAGVADPEADGAGAGFDGLGK